MKTVCIVPIKKNSKRIKGKNFKLIAGKPLYTYLLSKLKFCNFDEVYIDSDSDVIKNYALKNNFKFINRLKKLSKDTANGNHLLNYHSRIIKADLYFQLFVTAPLLSVHNINKCITKLKNSKKNDSIFTIVKEFSYYWFDGKSINYKNNTLPRSQDLDPVIRETTGLYGITNDALKKRKCRIGYKPMMHEISKYEAIDIDNKVDLLFLDNFIKNNKNK